MQNQDRKDTILIVDDVPGNIDFISDTLIAAYHVRVATSGIRALKIAEASLPDIILLDIMMPDMDGYEVLHRLKKNPLTSNIPVIFLTAKTKIEDEQKGLALGAVDYITKPFNPAIMSARINSQLELKDHREHIERMVFERTQDLEKAQKSLIKSQESLIKAQKIVLLGSWDRNIVKNTLSWSDELFRIFGLEPQSFSPNHETFLQYVHPDDREAVKKAANNSLTNHATSYSAEYRIICSDKTEKSVFEQWEVERDTEGAPLKTVGIVHDISEKKRSERALIAKKVAEQASQSKSDFLAKMSHEIRTPMNGVIGMLQLLEKTQLTNQQKRYHDIAVHSAELQLAVINDILDFSKIESGELTLEQFEFSLGAILEELIQILSEQAQNKGIELSLFLSPTLPKSVVGDKTRLKQVLLNLLSNAIKFTQDGGVSLWAEVAMESLGEDNPIITFRVEDSGIGIDPESQKKLFKPFVQANSSTARQYGGTGLGLVISKQIVEAMGGEIHLTSQENTGTTFHVSIPFAKGEHSAIQSKMDIDHLQHFPILLVDSNETTRMMLMQYFASWKASFRSAPNKTKALRMAQSAQTNGAPYQLIVLDYDSEDKYGSIFIQQNPTIDLTPSPRILYMISGEIPKKIAAGISETIDFIKKPINKQQLLEKILANLPGQYKLSTKATPQFQGSVLLVEDVYVNQEVALGMLREFGIEAELAIDGYEALNKCEKHSYDLVFMDIQLPGMDGFEVVGKIRAREQENGLERTPIVALTAKAISGEKEMSSQAGMDLYLTKPVRFAEIEGVLSKWLRPESEADVEPLQGRPAFPVIAKEAAHLEPEELIDVDALKLMRKLLRSVPGRYEVVLEQYLESAHQLLAEIGTGLAEGSNDELYRPAHKIKSQSASVGAKKLAELCGKMESIGREGLVAGISELLEQAREELSKVEPILRKEITKESVS